MQDDFTTFWNNNARARALFDDLLARCERSAYDNDYLAVLDDYEKESPDHPHLYIFAARYMLAHGDAVAAAGYGERAFLLRPSNHAVWDVLARAYTALGRYDDALVMQGYAENLYRVPISLHIPATKETKNSIGHALLSSMPKGAVLINTARKEVINEPELVKVLEERPDFKYLTDIIPGNHAELAEKFAARYFSTPKKMGAQTAEANINAGIAAANQIVDFLKNGNRKFQVNK